MFDWNNYLKLAEELSKPHINIDSNEACLRSAVSRAYYAVYHKAKKTAENKDSSLLKEIKSEPVSDVRGGDRRRGDHEVIAEFWSRYSGCVFSDIGLNLGRLHKERVKCDYYDKVDENINKNVIKTIENAKEILSKIPS